MNATTKILIVLVLAGAVAGTLAIKVRQEPGDSGAGVEAATGHSNPPDGQTKDRTPRLVDLGADKCIPCKMMAPILEELKSEYQGRLEVEFLDVWKNPGIGEEYGVQIIPTQIFYDASGKELFRHTGFFAKEDILAKWRELGVQLGPQPNEKPAFSRWVAAKPDERPKDEICYLCDGDIDVKTRTVMKTEAGDVAFCSPHCYIVTYASLTDEKKSHAGVSTTNWGSGELTSLEEAKYLYGIDDKGRPTIKAFALEDDAKAEQTRSGGNVLTWTQLDAKEQATRCGFCDRPVYAEDASVVRVNGMQTWGCCVMCALGVAARTGQDIEVEAKDALTGELVRLKTYEGHVVELEPPTAIAWAGAVKDADGAVKSTGCFKQAFFTNEENLMKWVEANPSATGNAATIEQCLAAKMKLTPDQIEKACKIGECAPK